MDDLVPKNHLLRLIDKAIDWTFICRLVEDKHSPDMGRPRRARYYSTELIRFINQDIVVADISNSNSLNRYTYVEGSPATLIDPFELCSERINNIVIGALDIGRGASEV